MLRRLLFLPFFFTNFHSYYFLAANGWELTRHAAGAVSPHYFPNAAKTKPGDNWSLDSMVGLSDWLCGLKSLKATHSPALTPDKPTFPQRTIPRIAVMLRCRTSALRLPSSPRALDKSGAPASKVPAPSRSARPQKPGAPLLSFRQKTSSNPGHFAPPTFCGDGSTSGASHPLTQGARCPETTLLPVHNLLENRFRFCPGRITIGS